MKKVASIASLIVIIYVYLFVQEVYSQPSQFEDVRVMEELIQEEWSMTGEIQLNKTFILQIEGETYRKAGELNFRIQVSPQVNKLSQKLVDIELTGIIGQNQIVLNKSVFNDQKLTINKKQMINYLKTNQKLDTKFQESLLLDEPFKETFDESTCIVDEGNMKIHWLRFVELPYNELIKGVGAEYSVTYMPLVDGLKVNLVISEDQMKQINIKILENDVLISKLCLRQSHF